ncbi:MAG: carotenoid 1,2-hydratase [bacterium]|nr:carotenoid 1,2-hydratase [bacterium]
MRRPRYLLLALPLLAACRDTPPAPMKADPPLSAVEALAGGDVAGYTRALEPRDFTFPDDHGPHPDFKTEWWYFTGHLREESDRRYGYQLTFFRSALASKMPERDSAWATRQVYLAHFALSDVDGGSFRSFERLSRGGAGLAGAGGAPFRVWLEDWSVESIGDADFPVRLRARDAGVELDLTLVSQKPTVLHGEAGLSRKGAGPGDASYYYSLTRLAADGRLRIDDREMPVTGSSWLDREWSTSVLTEDQVGWDWFALQLDDGRELMTFQLRLEGGGTDAVSTDPVSHGTLVYADGTTRPLALGDYRIEVLDTWRSPRGATYPAGWRLRVASESLDLEIEPLLADQELDVSFRYWEGAVGLTGSVDGVGYVELVGY